MYATPGAVAPLVFLLISLHVACTCELGSAAAGESCLQVYLFENRYMSTSGHRRPACVTSCSTHGGRAGSCVRWNMPMYVFVFVYACTCMNMDIYKNYRHRYILCCVRAVSGCNKCR